MKTTLLPVDSLRRLTLVSFIEAGEALLNWGQSRCADRQKTQKTETETDKKGPTTNKTHTTTNNKYRYK